MDLQARKISFVQEFLGLQNEELISLFEKLLKREKLKNGSNEYHPMSIEEFNERIDKSMEDSLHGRLTEESELKAEIEKWS